MISQEIGEIFKKRRRFLGLRQEDVEELSGVNMKTIQQVELGRGNPSIVTLEKIASILGMEVTVQVKDQGNG